MKLRNKKTGYIATLDSGHWDSLADSGGKLWLEAGGKDFYYYTLAGLNEEWEDYKPAEPLIKDEKVRKAVRAWAEANGIEQSSYLNVKFDRPERRLKWIRTNIDFDSIEGLENLDDDGEYTIAELCGEEEE